MEKMKYPKPFFGFQEMATNVLTLFPKPSVITRQTQEQVICMMAAVNNVCQDEIYSSFTRFKSDARAAWLKGTWKPGKTNAERSEASKEMMLSNLFGGGGVSGHLICPVLKNIGVNCIPGITKDDCAFITNGIIVCRMKEGFLHAIAIRNGWAIDSIGSKVYKWNGKIKGGKTIEYGVRVFPPE